MLAPTNPVVLSSSVASSNEASGNDINHLAIIEVSNSTPQHLDVRAAWDIPNPTIAITPPPTSTGASADAVKVQRESEKLGSPSKLSSVLPKASKANALPTAICAYYLNSIKGIGQGCLRVNCKFFHGTEEQLAELRKRHKRLKSPSGSSNCSTRSVSSNASGGSGKKSKDVPTRLKMVKDNELGNKRPIVCLNYLTDTCHRPGCRFLHLPPNVRPLPMTVCDYFATGTCTRKRCRFFHGTQDVLSRMHARGVTMYNPITNEAHDPSASLEELMKLQERTTVPMAPAAPPHTADGQAPLYQIQYIQPYAVNGTFLAPQRMPLEPMPYTHFIPQAQQRFADPNATQVINVMTSQGQPVFSADAFAQNTLGPTTIIIQQGANVYPTSQGMADSRTVYANPLPQSPQAQIAGLPEGLLSAIMQQHPGATIITTGPTPTMQQAPPQHTMRHIISAPQHAAMPMHGATPTYVGPQGGSSALLRPRGPQWGSFE